MEEEFRPALREVVLAYGLASVLLWGLLSAAASLLPVPGFAVAPIEALTTFLAVAFFIFRVAPALVLHVENRYYVGDGVLRIRRRRGFGPVTILLQNVTDVVVYVPLLMRPFGVGTVEVFTVDCRARPLFNLKDPRAFAEKIRPSQAGEPVFRPSVG